MRKNKRFAPTWMVLALVLVGCFGKPESHGEGTQLFVIADAENWEKLQPALTEAFQKVIKTPQPEMVFELVWVAPERFAEFATRKHLLLVGTLDSDGEISGKVSEILSPEVEARVRDGSAFYFPKNDPWAKNQLLVVLAANTAPELAEKLVANKQELYNLFEEKLIRETREQMFSQLEQTEMAQKLLHSYGWTLRIQHDYIINIERPMDQFVMLRRSLPGRERWLFVHWLDDADPHVITEDWAIARRNKLTTEFYDKDIIDGNHVAAEEIDFIGRPALKLEGLWRNDNKMVGGPFRTYVFFDEPTNRIYMIDIAVYFPGGQKEPFLRQLDIMAHSFATIAEVSKES